MAQHIVPHQMRGRDGWFVRWREIPVAGHRKRRQKQFRGSKAKSDAWAFAREKERELQLGDLYRPTIKLAQLFDRYLAVHTGAASTKKMLRWKLDKALAAFGSLTPSSLTREEIESWCLTIPEGHRRETTQALKQAIRWAGKAGIIDRHHPALDVKNIAPVRPERHPFESWEDIECLADEIDARFSALIIFAAGTGLRPGEWIALERRDLDLHASPPSVIVRRRFTKDKQIVDATKNGKHRRVPLRPKVLEALESHPARLDSRLLFPAAKGGFIDLHNWREDYWHPAMVAAGFVTESGKPDRSPYALRHTYATWALRAGIPTFDVSRLMGCTVQMIEKHYGHVANDAAEWALDRLAAFDSEADGRKMDAQGAEE